MTFSNSIQIGFDTNNQDTVWHAFVNGVFTQKGEGDGRIRFTGLRAEIYVHVCRRGIAHWLIPGEQIDYELVPANVKAQALLLGLT